VDKDLELASSAGAAPLEQVKQTIHSDLEYVSIQVDSRTYGGWYRLLPDGQMELLALANMHCERRPENTPIEQARGMLADFIRVARPKQRTNGSAVDTDDYSNAEDRRDCAMGTLGALLYADETKTRVSEGDWVALLQSIAAADRLALRELYERTHRFVFTLMVQLTDSRETAEELTLDVFHDVWRRAPEYDAATASVLGWIMNLAQARAAGRPGVEQRKKPALQSSEASEVAPCPTESLWRRLAQRIAAETGVKPVASATPQWTEPEWEDVAPGISCKLLATDTERRRVSMLVRLAPGIDYPPHTHAGVEELHLLDGELLIDDRLLYPGDYNRAEPGTADKRVWSQTGCTCVLITSIQDVIA
jgi:DNA-directed RNA polymerase specialized sigma24 family protein